MAGPGGGTRGADSNATDDSAAASRDELKRTLDRDTAVQGADEGEGEGEAAIRERDRADSGRAGAPRATVPPTSKQR